MLDSVQNYLPRQVLRQCGWMKTKIELQLGANDAAIKSTPNKVMRVTINNCRDFFFARHVIQATDTTHNHQVPFSKQLFGLGIFGEQLDPAPYRASSIEVSL